MYLRKINLKNYRQFENITINFENDLTAIAGPNNSGKTSLIELIKEMLHENNITYKYSDIPISAADQWSDKIATLLINNIVIDKSNDENIEIIDKMIFNDDVIKDEYYLSIFSANIQIDYIPEEDNISNFSDFTMDLDENSHAFYFQYLLQLNKLNFLSSLKTNLDKLKNIINYLKDSQKKDDEKYIKKSLLKEDILKIYCSSLKNKIYYCNSDFTNKNIIEDIVSFKNLFVIEKINALRTLDDNENDSSKSISKGIINVLKDKEEWIQKTKELPDKIHDIIVDSKIQEIIQDTSKETLKDTLNNISKTSGGNIDNIQMGLDININNIENFINKILCAKYNVNGILLNEDSQGLGHSNLIYIQLKLEEYKKKIDRTKVNLLIIEEPEVHMHPQMQKGFIDYLISYYTKNKVQGLVTSHSSEIIKAIKLPRLRVLRKMEAVKCELIDMNSFKNKIKHKFVNNTDPETKFLLQSFYDYFFEIGFSELIFADRAILYEGDTERLYIKHLLSDNDFKELNDKYISYIQVGGAYAINYKEILDEIKIKTLIITDLDYCKNTDNFEEIKNSESSNTTINNLYKEYNNNDTKNPTIKELYNWQNLNKDIVLNSICLKFQNEQSTARTLEEAMLNKLIGKNVFEKIKRSEWKEIRKTNKLVFTIPNNKDGENDSLFSIKDIVNSLANKKIDFMYSVIISNKGKEMLPDYLKEGLIWITK